MAKAKAMLWLNLRSRKPGAKAKVQEAGATAGRDLKYTYTIFLDKDFWVVVVEEVSCIDGNSNYGSIYGSSFGLLAGRRFSICSATKPRA